MRSFIYIVELPYSRAMRNSLKCIMASYPDNKVGRILLGEWHICITVGFSSTVDDVWKVFYTRFK